MAEAGNLTISQQLQSRMQPLGITSFRALAERAGVSQWQVRQLRSGHGQQMRLDNLDKIAQALQLPLPELLAWITAVDAPEGSAAEPSTSTSTLVSTVISAQSSTQPLTKVGLPSAQVLQQECDRLTQQLAQQRQTLQEEFQRASLYQLEAWMKNWPRVVHVVQTKNPDLPAAKILALVSPVSQLLQSWHVETIGTIGEAIAYDPTQHDLTGQAAPGDTVEVTRPGYRQGDMLLHRAEVKAG